MTYEDRYARGTPERLSALAAELVTLKPDVIVCFGTPSARAALKATTTIPIVFVGLGNPVGTGLVASLARPGGNATGTSIVSTEIASKWLQFLRQMAPDAIRLAYFGDALNPATVSALRQLEESSRGSNVTVQMLDARRRSDLERSLETVKREGVQGLMIGTAAVIMEHRDQIVQFAAREGFRWCTGGANTWMQGDCSPIRSTSNSHTCAPPTTWPGF